MKKILQFLTVFILLIANAYAQENTKLTFTDTNGKIYHATGTDKGLLINEEKNKIIFLEFFGHKCPPCLASIPKYKAIQTKYTKSVQVIAIEVQGYGDSEVKTFAKSKGINYITASQDKASNFVNYIAGRASWSGAIPYVVIIDKKGVVEYMHAGLLEQNEIEAIIKELSK